MIKGREAVAAEDVFHSKLLLSFMPHVRLQAIKSENDLSLCCKTLAQTNLISQVEGH